MSKLQIFVTLAVAKLQGGTGGYARYIAICPPDWRFGATIGATPEAPLPRMAKPLHWDNQGGIRMR